MAQVMKPGRVESGLPTHRMKLPRRVPRIHRRLAARRSGGFRIKWSSLLQEAGIDSRIYSVFGGLHLVDLQDSEVSSMISRLRDTWKLERVAAGHCTGEFAFSEFNRIFGPKLDHAGVGAVIPLPR
jgi:hypothetical protein